MEYQAKLPTRNSNVSHAEPLKEFATLIIGIGLLLLLLYWLSGLLVDYAVNNMSEQTTAELYHSLNRVTEQETLPENEVSPQLQALLTKLKTLNKIDYPISLTIANSKDMNALAFPTGHIVVYQALLDKMHTENGLAFVLAHELAHFKNRDHLRTMGRGMLLLTASVFLGLGDSDVLNMMTPLTDFSAAQFSQLRESAADASALSSLNALYGHVGGAKEFFEVLQASQENEAQDLSHYFSSHPQIAQRIDKLNILSKSMAYVEAETVALNK